jgi:hypothetical protein
MEMIPTLSTSKNMHYRLDQQTIRLNDRLL